MTTRLTPLFILLGVLLVLAGIGYVAYSIVQDVSRHTRSKMEGKNVLFTREGMKVGVREVQEEEYVDRSQSILVNMWNHTSFPAYKSRFWDMNKPTNWGQASQSAGSSKRK
ncbi:hypothetical protein BO82DRAFT_119971 [Aspergillus uvarum CBS 121591]|uniref:Uncharacterized protein n=1 Tax=Aspergillus uvarum CBS 121591 TaxID=1448315 RepID=A0A319C8G5_9EURO|nr:hypothetical protein BO82DRAFT_119971 [Aspergillus uvarum CBS 121591]PYH80037.1 hypothetical protein BO82DRAFT_119971 [Aspergillus uvarum CBS 121591]